MIPSTSKPSGADEAHLPALLNRWLDAGWLRALDLSLARLLADVCVAEGWPCHELTLVLAALCSHQVGRGHVCLDLALLDHSGLDELLSLPPEDVRHPEEDLRPSTQFRHIARSQWEQALDLPHLIGDGQGSTPLVRRGQRLYLRRYWQYEQIIAGGIRARLHTEPLYTDDQQPLFRNILDSLFARPESPKTMGTDWQKLACALAAERPFSIVTGGPGTGKTTTVVRLLAAIQAISPVPHRIQLAAPTGKAAARLSESISAAIRNLPLDELPNGYEVAANIPHKVTTLHRLLGPIPDSRRFRHHQDNPLRLDLLVIDEASMVDVEMMASVMRALPASSRLILLGDKDQLASVDAGAVLGDLCQRAEQGYYLDQTAERLRLSSGELIPSEFVDGQGQPLDQSVVMLRRSHRFAGNSGIGRLAYAINSGELDRRQMDEFRSGLWGDVAWLGCKSSGYAAMISRHALEGSPEAFAVGAAIEGAVQPPCGYRPYLERMRQAPADKTDSDARDRWASEVLTEFGRFQLLCALRQGDFGVEGLNALTEQALQRAGLIDPVQRWYAGRPVLVTRNDYNLGLMNGDIGITLPVPLTAETSDQSTQGLRVVFPAADGQSRLRWFSPSRLQAVQTVYAMTVHKSQGSEFEHACLVVPERPSPVLTRELIYTGVTRARGWFSLVVPDETTLLSACQRQVLRMSGLAELLENR